MEILMNIGIMFGILLIVMLIMGFVRSAVSRGDRVDAFSDGFFYPIETDNRRWVSLFIMAIVVSVIAWTHPGDPMVKSALQKFQQDPIKRQSEEIRKKYYDLRFEEGSGTFKTLEELCQIKEYGNDHPEECQKPIEETKSWSWWWTALIFWIATVIYAFPAFWDDVRAFGEGVYEEIRKSPGGEAKIQGAGFLGRIFGGGRTKARGGGYTAPMMNVVTEAAAQAVPGRSIMMGGMTPTGDFMRAFFGGIASEVLIEMLPKLLNRLRRN